MPKKRIFVSFDFDRDKTLKDFIIGQSRLPDSPFEVSDWSLKEAAPEASWEQKANHNIMRSDLVIVMVGPQTHQAPGVRKEVDMARAAYKPVVQIIGYKDSHPTPVENAGRLYRWDWENIRKIVNSV